MNFRALREPLAALGVQLHDVPSSEHARDGRCKSCGVRGLRGVVVEEWFRERSALHARRRGWCHIADVCSSDCAMAVAIEHRLIEDDSL